MATSSKIPLFRHRNLLEEDVNKYAPIVRHVKAPEVSKVILVNDIIEMVYGVSTVIPEDRALYMHKYRNGLVLIDKARKAVGWDNEDSDIVGFIEGDSKRIFLLMSNKGIPYYKYDHLTSLCMYNAGDSSICLKRAHFVPALKDFVDDHFYDTYSTRAKLIPEQDFINRNHRHCKLTMQLREELVIHHKQLSDFRKRIKL